MLRCLSPDAYSSADCRLPLVNIASACGRRVATAPVMLGGGCMHWAMHSRYWFKLAIKNHRHNGQKLAT
jgi:hypothetical protein